jgi:Ran GTPase-activating protein (RanGAP) involved in mRNA processing and transport
MEEEFDGDVPAGEERRRGVKFVEDDRENDAAAFLKERTIEREERMREMEERERDIERAAEAAWRAEAEDDDGQDEDERAAVRELGRGEEDEDEEGEEDEDEEGGAVREGEWEGAEEEDGQEAAWPQDPLARTSTADRSFDDATQDPNSLEFVKSAPRRSQAYEPKNHPLAERLDEMEEAVFAVTSRTEKGQRIQLPEHLEKLQKGPGVPDSRPQSSSSEASLEDHGEQRDDDQCLSPIIKGAVEGADGRYYDPANDNGVQAYLRACFDMRTTPVTKLCSATQLTSLDLAHRGIGNRGSTALATFLGANSTLTDLRLDDNNIGPEGAHALFQGMAKSNTLRVLHVTANPKIFPAITSSGGGVPQGESGAGTGAGLVGWLGTAASLQTLDLGNCKLGDAGVKAIASALEKNVNDTLAHLRLASNEITDEGAGVLFSVLARCDNTCVREVDLEWNRLRDASHMVDALRSNPSLQKLYLQWNKLGDKGAMALAQAMVNGAAVSTLDLSHNDLSGECCEALARGLKCSRWIKDLSLCGNPIGLTGAVMLLSGVDREGPMSRLLLQGCGLNARDGIMVEVLSPEGQVTRNLGDNNVDRLRDLCPEMLGTLDYVPPARKPGVSTGKGTRVSTAASGKQEWVRPVTGRSAAPHTAGKQEK